MTEGRKVILTRVFQITTFPHSIFISSHSRGAAQNVMGHPCVIGVNERKGVAGALADQENMPCLKGSASPHQVFNIFFPSLIEK